jgi:hypothetical protein
VVKQERDRRLAGQLRRLLPVLIDPGHVDMRNEVVGVGAAEHEHLDGVVGLGSLNEGDQVADEFGPEQIHGRGRDLREQNGPLLAHGERVEYHGISFQHAWRALTWGRLESWPSRPRVAPVNTLVRAGWACDDCTHADAQAGRATRARAASDQRPDAGR